MASFDTTAIVAAIRVRAASPSSGQALSTAQILRILDDETLPVVALIKSQRENFFQTSSSQSLVASQAGYRIPSRAVGASIHQALYVDADGQEIPLNPLQVSDVPRYRSQATETGTPHSFYLDQAQVVLVPAPATASGSLKLVYETRPNRLVATTETATITAINTGTNQVTISSAPTGFPTSSTRYDFIKATSPFECLAVDQSATRSSTTLTFSSLPSGLAVGDYVALAGETPVPQVPQDLIPLLQARGTVAVLQTLGDQEAVGVAVGQLQQAEAAAVSLISPRVSGQAVKAIGGIHRTGRRFVRRP